MKRNFLIGLFSLAVLASLFGSFGYASAQFASETSKAPQYASVDAFKNYTALAKMLMVIMFVLSTLGVLIAFAKIIVSGGSESLIREGYATLWFSLTFLAISLVGYIVINIIIYFGNK